MIMMMMMTMMTMSDDDDDDDDGDVSDVDSILKEEANFYKSLYTSGNDDVEDSQYDVFFKNSLISPLSAENANICEGKLSEKECRLALSEMHHRKYPGSDGFTSEFYKFFGKKSLTMSFPA